MSVWILYVNNKGYDENEWAVFGSRKDLFAYVRFWYPKHKQRTADWAMKASTKQSKQDYWWYRKQDQFSSLE